MVVNALKLTVQKKNWLWMGGVPGVLTMLSYAMQIVKVEWWMVALLFIGGLLVIGLMLFLQYLIPLYVLHHSEKKEASCWGEAVKELAIAYAAIHQLERQVQSVNMKDIAMTLGKFCDVVKKIFDRLTESNCCVSIKVPVSNYTDSGEWNTIQVKNVARDRKHITDRDTEEYKAACHDVLGNTAYSRVISLVLKESSKPHIYLNNDVDLEKDPNYATTSQDCNDRTSIPYKSELVVPILPSNYSKLSEVTFGGFLCIDSDKKNAFREKGYDVPMTLGLADGLYVLMIRLLELQDKSDN